MRRRHASAAQFRGISQNSAWNGIVSSHGLHTPFLKIQCTALHADILVLEKATRLQYIMATPTGGKLLLEKVVLMCIQDQRFILMP